MKTTILASFLLLSLFGSTSYAQDEDMLPTAEPVDEPMSDPESVPEPEPVSEPAAVTPSSDGVDSSSAGGSLAADRTGVLGIGVGNTIPGTTAVLAHHYLSPTLGIQAGLGFGFNSWSGDVMGQEVNGSFTDLALVGYGVYQLRAYDDLAINALGGLELGRSSFSIDNGMESDVSSFDMRLAGGLQAEYFILPELSLYFQAGLTIALLGDVSSARLTGFAPNTGADTSTTQILLGPGSIQQAIGMTWWMK